MTNGAQGPSRLSGPCPHGQPEAIATVNHELRTPLASILGYAEVLGEGSAGELTGEQTRLVGAIHRNARRLERGIDQLVAELTAEGR